MQGICPANVLPTPTREYELKERAAIVKLLDTPLGELDDDKALEVRIAFVDNLAIIYNRQESCRKYKAPKLEQQPIYASGV